MVDWKIYIDSVQKRALALCEGSLDEGDGFGIGLSYGDSYGDAQGDGWGGGRGYGRGGGADTHFNGNGFSTQVWQ